VSVYGYTDTLCVQLCTAVYSCVQLCTAVYSCVQLCTAAYSCVQLCIVTPVRYEQTVREWAAGPCDTARRREHMRLLAGASTRTRPLLTST